MYRIYLATVAMAFLFTQASSVANIGTVTGLEAATAPGIVNAPVQQTAQRWNGAPETRGRMTSIPLYTINISIEGLRTNVILDTGSSDLWVTTDCSTLDRPEGFDIDALHPIEYCKSIDYFHPELFATAGTLSGPFSNRYGDNSITDLYFLNDTTLAIGGLEIPHQRVGVALASQSKPLGALGMGPSPSSEYNLTSSRNPSNLLLDSMVSQGLIASRAFSLYLSPYGDGSGSILFGGLDMKKFQGSLQTLPLESPEPLAGAYDPSGRNRQFRANGQAKTGRTCSGFPQPADRWF